MADLIKTEQERVLDRIRSRSSDILTTFIEDTGTLDVVFMFDTTGSMSSYLNEVQRNVIKMIEDILKESPSVQFGVIVYKDHGSEGEDSYYLTKTCHLTNNKSDVINFLRSDEIAPGAGGGGPEAVECALNEATNLSWASNTKAIILIGDEPPHGVMDSFNECPRGIDYREETKKLSDIGVKIYSVLCNNVYETEVTFKWFADQTNGKFLKLQNISDLVDLIVAVCMKETGSLASFGNKLIESGKMTETKKQLLLELGYKG